MLLARTDAFSSASRVSKLIVPRVSVLSSIEFEVVEKADAQLRYNSHLTCSTALSAHTAHGDSRTSNTDCLNVSPRPPSLQSTFLAEVVRGNTLARARTANEQSQN